MTDNRSEDSRYVKWAKSVKVRDNYTCQICNTVSNFKIQLDSHHMNSWDWCVEERYSIQNGICLCETCHLRYHKYTSFGKNTKENFLEYMKVAKIFHEVLLNDQEVKIAKIFLNILSSERDAQTALNTDKNLKEEDPVIKVELDEKGEE